MKNQVAQWLVLTMCLFYRTVLAAPLQVGDAVPVIAAKDQHGAAYTFANGTAFLLVATEMGSAKTANQKLAGEGAGFLAKHHAAYLMDIHTMPAVARYFAFPKLRKYPQRIVLVDNAETLSRVPVQPGRITILKLTPDRRIAKVSFWQPANEPVTEVLK